VNVFCIPYFIKITLAIVTYAEVSLCDIVIGFLPINIKTASQSIAKTILERIDDGP
ncbi:MAG: hypothetical protein ACI88H_003946, partial [Cocleimonas sp.]